MPRCPGIKVAGRTSSFSFRGKDLEFGEIGKRLNVDHILEGSVRKAGNRIRVTAQLIKVADGFHLWSERYDREMTDIFAIQDEITQAIAAALQMKLSPEALYLVTGGLGGLGLCAAERLVERGARHLVLMGRSRRLWPDWGPTPEPSSGS